ncbi:MAG: hypothetical protein AAF747_04615, partial [Planctomycetota bacterium]
GQQVMHTLAYRPFLDPIDAHAWWFLLLLPLAFGIAVAFRAVRMRSLDRYWRAVAIMTGQIVVGILALAVAAYIVIEVILPIVTPMPA